MKKTSLILLLSLWSCQLFSQKLLIAWGQSDIENYSKEMYDDAQKLTSSELLVKNLNDRMANHRKKSKLYQHIKKVGKDKFKIKLVKNYPCNNLNELKSKEFNEMKKIKKSKLLNMLQYL